MKCTNHDKEEAVGTCVGCGDPFCSDCVTKVKNKNYCEKCLSEKVEIDSPSKSDSGSSTVVVEQTQTVVNKGGFIDSLCKGCCVVIIIIFILYVLLVFVAGMSSYGVR